MLIISLTKSGEIVHTWKVAFANGFGSDAWEHDGVVAMFVASRN